MTPEDLEQLDELLNLQPNGIKLPGAELHWEQWLYLRFPGLKDLAPRMYKTWNWFDSLVPGVKPRPRVEVWPRGGAKSATGELGCVWIGHKLSRRFALWVSETQPQADKRVQTVASHFERLGVGRAVGKYGNSKGWKRDQLRTENGFNVAAIGLDVAARGIRLDEFRPDIILFDDIDGRHDTPAKIKKKVSCITDNLLPAGSSDCAIIFLQNLIHRNSIVKSQVDGTAEFLYTREVPTVEPAIVDLVVDQRKEPDGTLKYYIIGGTPTWAGQNLETCQTQINDWGLPSFLREAQQQVDEEEGGLWTREILRETRRTSHPPLYRIGVGIDPNNTEGGDAAGIVVAGIAKINDIVHAFVLEDATVDGGPKMWAEAAVAAFNRHSADFMVAEKNNGGEMVEITIKTVPGAPNVKLVHASRGKITRAEPVQKLYADGRAHHVGHFTLLENEQCTYKAGMLSPNRMDAAVWVLTELMLETPDPPKGHMVPPSAGLFSWNSRPRH